jgi:hypothetical protein
LIGRKTQRKQRYPQLQLRLDVLFGFFAALNCRLRRHADLALLAGSGFAALIRVYLSAGHAPIVSRLEVGCAKAELGGDA